MQDSSQVMHILLRTSFKKVKQYRTFVPPMSGGLNLEGQLLADCGHCVTNAIKRPVPHNVPVQRPASRVRCNRWLGVPSVHAD